MPHGLFFDLEGVLWVSLVNSILFNRLHRILQVILRIGLNRARLWTRIKDREKLYHLPTRIKCKGDYSLILSRRYVS